MQADALAIYASADRYSRQKNCRESLAAMRAGQWSAVQSAIVTEQRAEPVWVYWKWANRNVTLNASIALIQAKVFVPIFIEHEPQIASNDKSE